MSEIKVNSIKGVSASTAAISIDNSSGTCTANITNNLSNRNLIINGAMQVAQRGTTSTADGYHTVDRFQMNYGGEDNVPTQEHETIGSGTEPYNLGFRRSYKIVNGNQTSGLGSGDYMFLRTRLEAQDIANSGWNYTSASSFITLSFWVRSSVAQVFNARLVTEDGTAYNYPFQYTIASANTWQKVTQSISGNSNLQFDENNNLGLTIFWDLARGTNFTDNSVTNDAWAAFASGTRSKDSVSTWYTTNLATLQITGVQLEVDHTGSGVATDFEHRPYAQELALCRRYCQVYLNPKLRGVLTSANTQFQRMGMPLLETMRADPSATWSGSQGVYDGAVTALITGINVSYPDPNSYEFDSTTSGSLTNGAGAAVVAFTGNDEGTLTLSAEL